MAAGLLVGVFPLIAGLLPAADDATRLGHLIVGSLAAGLPFLVVLATWRRAPATRTGLYVTLAVAALTRAALLTLPPLLSEDLWRYLWDGAVTTAGINPFRFAPNDPALDGLARDPALASIRSQIGHAHIPTIYPPAAQALFATLHPLGLGATGLRATLALADLVTIAALWRWLAARGAPPNAACLFAFAPLPLLESAVGGHVDALGVAALTVAGALLAGDTAARGRRAVAAGTAVAIGIGVKLLPALALPWLWRKTRPVVGWTAVVTLLLTLPFAASFLMSDGDPLAGLRAYGHRWRGNDGAFALLHGLGELGFTSLAGGEAITLPGWLADAARMLIGGGDRPAGAALWPDELAFATAKALVAAALMALLIERTRRGRTLEDTLGPLVLAVLLLSPIVHPWYLTWAAPFATLAVVGAAPRWLSVTWLWTLTVPLAYLPRPGYLRTGEWDANPLATVAEYLPVALGLAIAASRAVKRGAR